MGLNWLKYLQNEVGDDGEIEEIEVKIEYEDGTKKKWIFTGDQDPVYEDGEDEDEEGDSEEGDSEEDDSEDDSDEED
ncbi:DNA primase [uncultured Brevibacillus sp.]|uniref:DNA primase n=1 Tax=uncultured Brevibacillus sp. TaxID=169970 RepID=UPI002596D537|nr:DNA primase [uncultured Brevibacillus sp.]